MTIRITFACPQEFVSDANQLARVVGYSAEDDKTYGECRYHDADGNLYSVASGLMAETFIQTTTSPLIEPEWGADMEAANRAQMMAALGEAASPNHIAAFVGDDVAEALEFLGLELIINELPEPEITEADPWQDEISD